MVAPKTMMSLAVTAGVAFSFGIHFYRDHYWEPYLKGRNVHKGQMREAARAAAAVPAHPA